MAFIGNLLARKAYLSHAKAIRANDQQDYKTAIDMEARAMEGYEKALAKGMSNPGFLMAYAVLLLRTGKFERAMEIVRKTEKLPGLSVDQKRRLMVNYSICQWKLGELDHAIGAMRELMKNYKNSTVYGSLGYMLIEKGDKTGDYSEAQKFNAEALDYDDEDAVVLDNVGQYYQRMGDIEKARGYFEKALEIRPVQVDSMYYLARIKQQQGDIEGAKQLIDKAMSIHFSALATVNMDMLKSYRAELDSAPKAAPAAAKPADKAEPEADGAEDK